MQKGNVWTFLVQLSICGVVECCKLITDLVVLNGNTDQAPTACVFVLFPGNRRKPRYGGG